jgi:hypothetical protein
MTTNDIVNYYINLLIVQYNNKAKARATVDAVVRPIIMDQLPVQVQNAYNIDTAVGVQLDTIAKYVGVLRSANTLSGYVTLSDADFRQLIKFGIIVNNGGSSLYDIQQRLYSFFPGNYLVYDYRNMHMDYVLSTAIGTSALAVMLVAQKLLPRPMAVQLGALIYIANLANIFGMRTYDTPPSNVTGFNKYTGYTTNTPWISYTNAIT